MTDSNIQQYNDLLSRNLMLLSTYPVGFYNQLWNENNELKKDNDSLTESNRVLRKRNYEYLDKNEFATTPLQRKFYEHRVQLLETYIQNYINTTDE